MNIVLGVSSKSFSDVCTYAYRMKKSTDRIRNVQLFLTKQKKSTKTKKQLIDCTLSVLRILCFLPFFLSFYLSKIAHLKIFCEIATYTSRLVSFDKGLDHSGAGSDSSGAFLGSQWDRHLKFSAYASFLISGSLSKFELI